MGLKIIILIIILLIPLLIYLNNKNEDFKSVSNNKSQQFDPVSIKDYKDRSITEQFPDITVYENEYDNNEIKKLGIDSCLEDCDKNNCNCVEFGYSGVAWGFPQLNYENEKNFKTDRNKYNDTTMTYINF
jgi:hypothetical protein